jgi:hypothetical protein
MNNTHEIVIGPFLFDEDTITSNSSLDILQNYALLLLSNNKHKTHSSSGPCTVPFVDIFRN